MNEWSSYYCTHIDDLTPYVSDYMDAYTWLDRVNCPRAGLALGQAAYMPNATSDEMGWEVCTVWIRWMPGQPHPSCTLTGRPGPKCHVAACHGIPLQFRCGFGRAPPCLPQTVTQAGSGPAPPRRNRTRHHGARTQSIISPGHFFFLARLFVLLDQSFVHRAICVG